MPESDLVKTGIKGLDEVLFGGIPRGNIILVAGSAGTGKTTLGVEFVYRGARQFNEPGVIVLFEVAPDKLIRDAALFGWDLRGLERGAATEDHIHDTAGLSARLTRIGGRHVLRLSNNPATESLYASVLQRLAA